MVFFMKFIVRWGITPKLPELGLSEKVLGNEVIEANTLLGAKRKAKSLANRCDKLSDAYSDYLRSWLYWSDWKNRTEGIEGLLSEVFSSDYILLDPKNMGCAFIRIYEAC